MYLHSKKLASTFSDSNKSHRKQCTTQFSKTRSKASDRYSCFFENGAKKKKHCPLPSIHRQRRLWRRRHVKISSVSSHRSFGLSGDANAMTRCARPWKVKIIRIHIHPASCQTKNTIKPSLTSRSTITAPMMCSPNTSINLQHHNTVKTFFMSTQSSQNANLHSYPAVCNTVKSLGNILGACVSYILFRISVWAQDLEQWWSQTQ